MTDNERARRLNDAISKTLQAPPYRPPYVETPEQGRIRELEDECAMLHSVLRDTSTIVLAMRRDLDREVSAARRTDRFMCAVIAVAVSLFMMRLLTLVLS